MEIDTHEELKIPLWRHRVYLASTPPQNINVLRNRHTKSVSKLFFNGLLFSVSKYRFSLAIFAGVIRKTLTTGK